MGTPVYAIPTLEALYAHDPTVLLGVVTQPAKPQGRGLALQQSSVATWATARQVPVWTPDSKADLARLVMELNPDLIVVIAYGMILPSDITQSFLCVNLHGSLLPAYRGASPVQATLLNGDTVTGVTLIHMNAKMDEGPILAQTQVPIHDSDRADVVFEHLANLSAQLLLDWMQSDRFLPVVQDHFAATYCQKIATQDAYLDPDKESPQQMWRKIKAFYPKPGAFVTCFGKRVKVLEARYEAGVLYPLVVQPEGKKIMSIAQFESGYGCVDLFGKESL